MRRQRRPLKSIYDLLFATDISTITKFREADYPIRGFRYVGKSERAQILKALLKNFDVRD
jgi:hypothetical protein